MLTIDWYIQPPIDFEHKNYMLLDYVQKIDESFKERKLSPYLLHTELLVTELKTFLESRKALRKALRKKTLNLSRKIYWVVSEAEETEELKSVIEVVEYSTPILESKIMLGYKILTKHPQVLWDVT